MKIFKAVQKLKNLAKQNDGNNRGNCETKTADKPKHFDREYFGGKKDLDFFFSNNASQPKSKTKYETIKIRIESRIKSCNFLTNISYRGMKEEDLFDRSFVFDVYTMTTKNINPFSLERKIFDVKDCKMINIFWEQSNEPSFYKLICKPPNFLYLNGKNVTYPKVAQIEDQDEDHENEKKIADKQK